MVAAMKERESSISSSDKFSSFRNEILEGSVDWDQNKVKFPVSSEYLRQSTVPSAIPKLRSKIVFPHSMTRGSVVGNKVYCKTSINNCFSWRQRSSSHGPKSSTVFMDFYHERSSDIQSSIAYVGDTATTSDSVVAPHHLLVSKQCRNLLLSVAGVAGMQMLCPALRLPLLDALLISHHKRRTSLLTRGGWWRFPLTLALAVSRPFYGSLLRRSLTAALFILQLRIRNKSEQNPSSYIPGLCSIMLCGDGISAGTELIGEFSSEELSLEESSDTGTGEIVENWNQSTLTTDSEDGEEFVQVEAESMDVEKNYSSDKSLASIAENFVSDDGFSSNSDPFEQDVISDDGLSSSCSDSSSEQDVLSEEDIPPMSNSSVHGFDAEDINPGERSFFFVTGRISTTPSGFFELCANASCATEVLEHFEGNVAEILPSDETAVLEHPEQYVDKLLPSEEFSPDTRDGTDSLLGTSMSSEDADPTSVLERDYSDRRREELEMLVNELRVLTENDPNWVQRFCINLDGEEHYQAVIGEIEEATQVRPSNEKDMEALEDMMERSVAVNLVTDEEASSPSSGVYPEVNLNLSSENSCENDEIDCESPPPASLRLSSLDAFCLERAKSLSPRADLTALTSSDYDSESADGAWEIEVDGQPENPQYSVVWVPFDKSRSKSSSDVETGSEYEFTEESNAGDDIESCKSTDGSQAGGDDVVSDKEAFADTNVPNADTGIDCHQERRIGDCVVLDGSNDFDIESSCVSRLSKSRSKLDPRWLEDARPYHEYIPPTRGHKNGDGRDACEFPLSAAVRETEVGATTNDIKIMTAEECKEIESFPGHIWKSLASLLEAESQPTSIRRAENSKQTGCVIDDGTSRMSAENASTCRLEDISPGEVYTGNDSEAEVIHISPLWVEPGAEKGEQEEVGEFPEVARIDEATTIESQLWKSSSLGASPSSSSSIDVNDDLSETSSGHNLICKDAASESSNASTSFPSFHFADHPTCVHLRKVRHSHGDQTYLELPELLSEPWRNLVYWHGRCRDGRPTLLVLLGKAVRQLSPPELKHFITVTLSHAEFAELHYFNRSVKQMNILIDLDGLGFMRLPPMHVLQSIGTALNRDYAGRGGRIFLVNAPMMLGLVMSAVQGIIMRPSYSKGAVIDKGFLEAKSQIVTHGSRYQATILKHFDEHMLPLSLGGTCSCTASKMNECELGHDNLLKLLM